MKIPRNPYPCNCAKFKEHVLDWYGKTQHKADWRKRIRKRFISELCDHLEGRPAEETRTLHTRRTSVREKPKIVILDNKIPPSPTGQHSSGSIAPNVATKGVVTTVVASKDADASGSIARNVATNGGVTTAVATKDANANATETSE